MKRSLLCTLSLCMLLFGSRLVRAQAGPTAARRGDLQVGLTYTGAKSDYSPNNFFGLGFYTTFDFKYHWGAIGEFHQLNESGGNGEDLYERTYELGGRYVLHYGPVHPYAKVLYGRGVFNFPHDIANLAYNIGAAGVGADVSVMKHVNVNVDYEYQDWFGFPPRNLMPQLVSVGAAYHF